jgi:hypothetical protein
MVLAKLMGLRERCWSGKAGPGTPQIFNPVGREKADRHLAVGGTPTGKCPQSNNAIYQELDECIQCTSLRRKRLLHIFHAGSASPSKPHWTVRRGLLGWFARRARRGRGRTRLGLFSASRMERGTKNVHGHCLPADMRGTRAAAPPVCSAAARALRMSAHDKNGRCVP